MKYNFLYSYKSNSIEQFDDNTIIHNLYYQYAVTPSVQQLINYNKSNNVQSDFKNGIDTYGPNKIIENIKKYISKIEYQIPLFDTYGENIYIIGKNNVFHRVVHNNYRFPDKQIIDFMNEQKLFMINKISKIPENNIDRVLYERKINKFTIAIDFMSNFDIDTLYNTYIRVYYINSDPISTNITTCKRPSFTSNLLHIKPYYSKNEMFNLALNMGIVSEQELSSESLNIDDICVRVKSNDIASNILLQHQKYMISNNKVGLIQYYTLHGSYFINQYLRNFVDYKYKNVELEHIIQEMYNLTYNAPKFDKNYILYRYINDDTYLSHLNVGDIFVEPGFMSTTRDPFYKNDTQSFGFILLEIKIPKDVVGVGLCVETLSHFPYEQEIILTPKTKIKLVNKIDKHRYYHSILGGTFRSQIKTKYEFEYIGRDELEPLNRIEYMENNYVDFLKVGSKLDKLNTLDEKIDVFSKTILDPMKQCTAKIGKYTYTIMSERFNSFGAYERYYAIRSDKGFSLYSIHNNNMLFFLEIGLIDNIYVMHVDYCRKYSIVDRKNIMSDTDFLTFISSIAHAFSITKVYVYSEYLSCDFISTSMGTLETFGNDIMNTNDKELTFNRYPKNNSRHKYRNYSSDKFDISNIESNISVNDNYNDDNDKLYGGIYSVDLFEYIYKGNKRHSFSNIMEKELTPQYSYYFLDKLKNTKPTIVLSKSDLDELYQIYIKIYEPNISSDKDNLGYFYIWVIFNKCHLVETLVNKFKKIFKNNNPFEHDYYILDPYTFLYNRNIVNIAPVAVNNIKLNIKRSSDIILVNQYVNRTLF